MITKNTTVYSLFKNSSCEKYKENLFYGWDLKNDHRKLINLCEDVWPNKQSIEGFKRLINYDKEGTAQLFKFSKTNNDLSCIAITHKEKSKVAIVTAGGAYCCVCNAVEALPVAMRLFDLGFSVFVPIYGINENAQFGKPTINMLELVKYLEEKQEHYNIDLKDYIIGGFSAGGHAVGILLTEEFGFDKYGVEKPKLLFLGYPVITMTDSTHIGTRDWALGKNFSEENVDRFSIEKHIVNSGIKVFHWQCDKDNVVPFENTLLLREALKKNGIEYISESYDADAHGWGIAEDKPAKGWVERMLKFYNE